MAGTLGSMLGGSLLGAVFVKVGLDTKELQTGLAKSKTELAAFEKSAATSGGRASTMFGKVGATIKSLGPIAAVAGAAVAVKLGAAAINAAADLNEAVSKTQQVFEGSSDSVLQFGEDAASSFGIANAEAIDAASNLGNMFINTGLAEQAAAKMSTTMVGLAGDMASFNNADPSEMLVNIRSGLAGEVEPLRRFGVNLSAAAVEAKAMEMGIADANGELTEAAKVQARYQLILEQTTKQQGDFGRTLETSLPNQLRKFKAELTNTAAELGQALLPAATEIVDVLGDFAGALKGLGPVIKVVSGNIDLLVIAYGTYKAAALAAAAANATFLSSLGPLAIAGAVALFSINKINEYTKETGDLFERAAAASPEFAAQIEDLDHKLLSAGKGSAGLLTNLRREAEAILEGSKAYEARDAVMDKYIAGTQEAAEETTKTRVAIRRFANMTAKELQEWRSSTKEDIEAASMTIGGLGEDWRKTARQTVVATRRMAKDAKQMAQDLDKLADLKAPDAFKQWLVEQGPGWVSGYVSANRKARDDIETYWSQAARATGNSKGAINDVTSKVKGLDSAITNLPSLKTIRVDIIYRYKTEGSPPPIPGGGIAGGGIALPGGFAAARGLITQRPTFLVGEGKYPTFAGKGAEAVIPLNDRGIGILAKALEKAGSRGGSNINVNLTVNGGSWNEERLAASVSRHLAKELRRIS